MRILSLIVVLLAQPASALAETFVYASIKGEKKIAVYKMNEEKGDLKHAADVATDGEPGGLTLPVHNLQRTKREKLSPILERAFGLGRSFGFSVRAELTRRLARRT
jgi:hypothetical protein